MKFPAVIFKPNEAPIYFTKEAGEFGLVSKNGGSFYKKGTVYDAEGTQYSIEGIDSITKAPILKSLKYFQPMYIVNVRYTTGDKISLSDFKQLVIKHFYTFRKYWVKRDLIKGLEASIMEKNSIVDIINFLE